MTCLHVELVDHCRSGPSFCCLGHRFVNTPPRETILTSYLPLYTIRVQSLVLQFIFLHTDPFTSMARQGWTFFVYLKSSHLGMVSPDKYVFLCQMLYSDGHHWQVKDCYSASAFSGCRHHRKHCRDPTLPTLSILHGLQNKSLSEQVACICCLLCCLKTELHRNYCTLSLN